MSDFLRNLPDWATASVRVSELLEGCLSGKNATLAVVGSSGVGKSTLVNTLLTRKVCNTKFGAKQCTVGVNKNVETVYLPRRRAATLTLYDTAGMTGAEEDAATKEALLAIKNEVDALLICFDFIACGGRYLPMLHGGTMKSVQEVFGPDFVCNHAVIVLTKANKASEESELTVI